MDGGGDFEGGGIVRGGGLGLAGRHTRVRPEI